MPALRETQWDKSRGKHSWAPVELLDVLPTLAELALLPTKYGGPGTNHGLYPWQGKSLLPILDDPENGYVKPFATAQYPRGTGSSKKIGYSFRTTRYRLTIWCRAPFVYSATKCYFEMYDFLSDPTESRNLAYLKHMIPVRQRMVGIWTQVQALNRAKSARAPTKRPTARRRRRGLVDDHAAEDDGLEKNVDVESRVDDENDIVDESDVAKEADVDDDEPDGAERRDLAALDLERPFDFDDRFALAESGKRPFP